MSVEVIESNGITFLYCNTSMRPLNLAAFDSEEEAQRFLDYVIAQAHRDPRTVEQDELEAMRDRFRALPACTECGERVIDPHEHDVNTCRECWPECEATEGGVQCDARGTELVDGESLARFCATHAAQARRARDDEDPPAGTSRRTAMRRRAGA